jgi:NhaA family Na+:H+ antiporter
MASKDTPRYNPATDAPVDALVRPFQRIFSVPLAGSLLLFAGLLLGLVLANTDAYTVYYRILHLPLGFHVGTFALDKPLLLWLNDGLMSVFFFVMGLEIKRELTVGELSNWRKALLPILAAVGGMVFPALLFLLTAPEGAQAGWGVPMATDIAFALGILRLFGARVPTSLFVFLTTLAIVDDLGAVLVIALFYTEGLDYGLLGLGLAFYAIQLIFYKLEVRNGVIYFIVGLAVWYCFLKAGIHPTIAGVMAAFTIPLRPRRGTESFTEFFHSTLSQFRHSPKARAVLVNEDALHAVGELKRQLTYTLSPVQRLEHSLMPLVVFVILPLFAFANAGVRVAGTDVAGLLGNPLALATALALVGGKVLGIFGIGLLAVRARLAALPQGMSVQCLLGTALLGGVGFTMSLFVAALAYPNEAMLDTCRVGILLGSAVAGAAGAATLHFSLPRNPGQECGKT